MSERNVGAFTDGGHAMTIGNFKAPATAATSTSDQTSTSGQMDGQHPRRVLASPSPPASYLCTMQNYGRDACATWMMLVTCAASAMKVQEDAPR